jgi:hypothetical protein
MGRAWDAIGPPAVMLSTPVIVFAVANAALSDPRHDEGLVK